MATFTLEDLGAVVEDMFAPTIIDMGEGGKLILRPSVNLSDEDTASLSRLQREINGLQGGEEPKYVDSDNQPREATEEESAAWDAEQAKLKPRMIEILHQMIYLIAGENGQPYAQKFLELKGQELGWLLALMKKYGASAQLGEASASSSS